MLITKELLSERIKHLQMEQTMLQASHDKMMREHQERIRKVQETANQNANRMHQILGAISQLTQLLNGENPNQESKPNEPTPTGGIDT